jgi:hypothetical protein
MVIRTYSELKRFGTLEERFDYLKLRGQVGRSTFGFDRYMNQQFYTSREWRQVRQKVIIRDNGCDLGIEGFEIHSGLYIHHMNPMTVKDISSGDPSILEPEFLITVTQQTHNAVHYGDVSLLTRRIIERKPGDTKLW